MHAHTASALDVIAAAAKRAAYAAIAAGKRPMASSEDSEHRQALVPRTRPRDAVEKQRRKGALVLKRAANGTYVLSREGRTATSDARRRDDALQHAPRVAEPRVAATAEVAKAATLIHGRSHAEAPPQPIVIRYAAPAPPRRASVMALPVGRAAQPTQAASVTALAVAPVAAARSLPMASPPTHTALVNPHVSVLG